MFFPWGYGAGLGYTARCIELSLRLAADGWATAFAGSGINRLPLEAGIRVFDQPTAASRAQSSSRIPPYLPFGNVERVFAVAAGYYRVETVRRQLEADLENLRAFDPDLVVIDMSPTGAIAARMAGKPILSLADTDFLSTADNSWMPWLESPANALLPHPSATDSLNAVLTDVGLDEVANPAELLLGDHVLIPSAPAIEPLPTNVSADAATYVGPLYWDPPLPQPIDLPQRDDRPTVYVSVGSGAMVPPEVQNNLIEALAGLEVNAFYSTGMSAPPVGPAPANVTFGGLTGLSMALSWADVVVSHGGYSTVIATLAHAKPSVVLPFMSEQEMNGRDLVEAHGAGNVVRKSRVDAATNRISFEYRSSGVSDDPIIPAIDIADAIDDVTSGAVDISNLGQLAEQLASCRTTDITAIADDLVRHG